MSIWRSLQKLRKRAASPYDRLMPRFLNFSKCAFTEHTKSLGRSGINGDFLRMFPEKNQILFSHCGAGPFSMARSLRDIALQESIETHNGLAVFFPADQPGTVTAVNLMGSRAGYRLAVMVGQVEETDMLYEGTPMRVHLPCQCNRSCKRPSRAAPAGRDSRRLPGGRGSAPLRADESGADRPGVYPHERHAH